MSWSEEEFEKLRNRDTRAFEKLYGMYKGKLYGYFLAKSGNDQDLAAELLSETFFSAINSIHTLKSASNIQGWLFQIAVRRYNDFLRNAYRTVGSDQAIDEAPSQERDAEMKVLEDEKIALLHDALGRLKPAYREILEMKYFAGMSEKDIASRIGKSIGAAEGLLFRARQALKKEMGSHAEYFREGI